MRLCGWTGVRRATRWTLRPLVKANLLRIRHKYHFGIPEYADIGPGLYINRFGGVYVHGDCVIGENFNINHMTLLGQTNRGERAGVPSIGDRVAIGVGASVLGAVHVGHDSVIGTSAVVTKDVPPRSVVVGIPGRVVSSEGSSDYVNRQVPADLLRECYEAAGLRSG